MYEFGGWGVAYRDRPPSGPLIGRRGHRANGYTPRTLTAPIVEHALAPAFERLGPGATDPRHSKAWRAVIALHHGHAQHARHSDGAGQDVDGDAGVQRAGTGGGVNMIDEFLDAEHTVMVEVQRRHHMTECGHQIEAAFATLARERPDAATPPWRAQHARDFIRKQAEESLH
jgi:hypothetical protein